ncbi:MAG: transcription antitermination factor NusB [Candidatus Velamenicoccus archaeovorus]
MASRHEARRRALDILYQADVTGADPLEVLAEWQGAGRSVGRFARQLVEGVTAHRAGLDEVIGSHAEGWTVPRMPALDRTILRLAVFELLHVPGTPVAVAIDEAVEAAKQLSTEDSGRFVNGVLGRVAREAREP